MGKTSATSPSTSNAPKRPRSPRSSGRSGQPKNGRGRAKSAAGSDGQAPKRAGRAAVAGKHLVIVESPAKAKTINRYLGPDFIVQASVGHVRDLPTKAPKGSKQPVPGVDLENEF